MLLYITNQIQVAPINLKEIIGVFISFIALCLLIWSLYEAFSRKANKEDIKKEMLDKLDKHKFDDFRLEVAKEHDRFDDQFDSINEKLDRHLQTSINIEKLLGRIDEKTTMIQKNCPKIKC